MDRTERLLDLVALLLDAREPLTWAKLREAFPSDYGSGSDDACLRKFERDKAELLELGIPLRYVQADDEHPDGYVVERDAYYLPPVAFSPEELAVLYTAGAAALESGAFPGRRELAHALRKVGYLAPESPPTPAVRMELASPGGSERVTGALEQLWAAAAARKRVRLTYLSPKQASPTEREVDPYGLALRSGVWTLVGHCHLRGDVRSFQVHRIQALEVNGQKPRTPDFQVPADFDVQAHVPQHPWALRLHAPLTVRLCLGGELAPLAGSILPGARLLARDADGTAAGGGLHLARGPAAHDPPAGTAGEGGGAGGGPRAAAGHPLGDRRGPRPGPGGDAVSEARERLKRLLLLVPYVARHPGITVDALAERLDVPRKVLLDELDLLCLVGKPPVPARRLHRRARGGRSRLGAPGRALLRTAALHRAGGRVPGRGRPAAGTRRRRGAAGGALQARGGASARGADLLPGAGLQAGHPGRGAAGAGAALPGPPRAAGGDLRLPHRRAGSGPSGAACSRRPWRPSSATGTSPGWTRGGERRGSSAWTA